MALRFLEDAHASGIKVLGTERLQMRLSFVLSLLLVTAGGSLMAQAPQMTEVQPGAGKIGSVLRVHGVYLDKTKVVITRWF